MIPDPSLYEAFGFGLMSDVPMPELPAASSGVEPLIRVRTTRLTSLPEWTYSPDGGWSGMRGTDAYFGWEGVGTFRVGPRGISVDPSPDVTPERLRIFLLGAAMGVALHLNGLLVLHGSAVVLNGGAVVFLGPKGSGKSTMAGSLVARGHDLITDDVVAIDLSKSEPFVRPGFSQLKLWPEAIDAIGVGENTYPKLHPDFEKRDVRVEGQFTNAPVPLRAVVLLTKSDTVQLEELDSVSSLAEIIRHWYCARFGYETLAALGITSQFLGTTRLANTVRCCRLGRPACLETIPDVAEAVERLL